MLRDIVEQLNGTMDYERKGTSRGWGAWVIRLNGKEAIFPAEGGLKFQKLDDLYLNDDELVPDAREQLLALLK